MELKPCPFCGGKAIIEEFDGGVWFVTCKCCDTMVAPIMVANSEEEAAKAWNRRADDATD